MPTYLYRCRDCGSERELFNRVSECESNAPSCCKAAMSIIPQAAFGFVQRECHYKCPVTGREVTSWRQRQNIMAEKNLVDANDFNIRQHFEADRRKHAELESLAAQLPPPPPGVELPPI